MSKRIYKYPLTVAAHQTVKTFRGAVILAIQSQHNEPVMWCEVDPDAPIHNIHILLVMTGRDVPDSRCVYLATTQHGDGAFVAHWYRGVE